MTNTRETVQRTAALENVSQTPNRSQRQTAGRKKAHQTEKQAYGLTVAFRVVCKRYAKGLKSLFFDQAI